MRPVSWIRQGDKADEPRAIDGTQYSVRLTDMGWEIRNCLDQIEPRLSRVFRGLCPWPAGVDDIKEAAKIFRARIERWAS